MIPKNTTKIILYLLKNISKTGYNINQLSKKLRISVGSAFKILKDLEKNKIVTLTTISNASYYKLNLNNDETLRICELLLLAEKRELKAHAKIYADDIIRFNYAELIIIFGSILKGKGFNDVDVLFVTNNIKKVNDFCLEISKIRSKPVVPLILTKNDLVKEVKKGQDSILEIIRQGVVLRGEQVLLEVIKNVNL